jgi:LacI family transcriptional regulator
MQARNGAALAFCVSRVTVRNAIERLSAARLVERIPGKGTYVLTPDSPQPPAADRVATSGTIALVCSQGAPSVASPVASGCSAAALAHRAPLLLCDTNGATFAEAHAREALHLREALRQGVSGIVIWWQGGDASRPLLERAAAEGCAVVMLDRCVEGLDADFVGIDDEAAGYMATAHLVRSGRRRIGCVVNSLKVSTSADRLAGYRRALAEHGLPVDDRLVVVVDEGAADVGALAAERFADLQPPPDGAVAVNDYIAMDVIEALERHRLHTPDDVAVVSFADMEFAGHYRVPLTTVRQPFRSLGETAIHLIHERLETGRTTPRRVLLPTELVIRRSCGHERPRQGNETVP